MEKTKKEEQRMFASLLSLIGSLSASTGTKACMLWFIDEPSMPKCMLQK